jgi:putative Ca2+/H+ antiporter (TMEM165/GDT1 family)
VEAFWVATGLVALAEIGDKTQLLSLLLAARFRRPVPILLGIAVATVLNHALAAALGGLLARWLPPEALRWLLALGFAAMALWALRPDKLEGDPVAQHGALGVFGVTCVVFFLAEIGDKTQLATVALAARYDPALVAVVLGTSLGMLLANAPVVLAGPRLLQRLPMAWVRRAAAAVFMFLAILVLLAPTEAFASP